jgi:hypothetical protein
MTRRWLLDLADLAGERGDPERLLDEHDVGGADAVASIASSAWPLV